MILVKSKTGNFAYVAYLYVLRFVLFQVIKSSLFLAILCFFLFLWRRPKLNPQQFLWVLKIWIRKKPLKKLFTFTVTKKFKESDHLQIAYSREKFNIIFSCNLKNGRRQLNSTYDFIFYIYIKVKYSNCKMFRDCFNW